MRVLVVEDEKRIARDIASPLERAGDVVEIVSDGEEAWFRADTDAFDAIVLDLDHIAGAFERGGDIARDPLFVFDDEHPHQRLRTESTRRLRASTVTSR